MREDDGRRRFHTSTRAPLLPFWSTAPSSRHSGPPRSGSPRTAERSAGPVSNFSVLLGMAREGNKEGFLRQSDPVCESRQRVKSCRRQAQHPSTNFSPQSTEARQRKLMHPSLACSRLLHSAAMLNRTGCALRGAANARRAERRPPQLWGLGVSGLALRHNGTCLPMRPTGAHGLVVALKRSCTLVSAKASLLQNRNVAMVCFLFWDA